LSNVPFRAGLLLSDILAAADYAAIAPSGGLTLATRNTKDFSDIDELPVVNPWT
jgi:predicted nucleic acid-binding protein